MKKTYAILIVLMVCGAGCVLPPKRSASPLWEQLHAAAADGNLVGAMQLLQRGVDVNARDPNGYTALTAAAVYGHRNVVKWLLGKGADVNAASMDGMTALMCAAYEGYPEVVRDLADKGADVNARTPEGDVTPLLFAALGNHPDVVATKQMMIDLEKSNKTKAWFDEE